MEDEEELYSNLKEALTEVMNDLLFTKVHLWHEGVEGVEQELHEYLGMTWVQYQLWAYNPSNIFEILQEELNDD